MVEDTEIKDCKARGCRCEERAGVEDAGFGFGPGEEGALRFGTVFAVSEALC